MLVLTSHTDLQEISPGTDIMITIFFEFCQFSAGKLAFFSKTNAIFNFLQKLAVVRPKNATFLQFFLAEIFLNPNIGP
jgi:hypothetical protein